jgi:hypothetical protein
LTKIALGQFEAAMVRTGLGAERVHDVRTLDPSLADRRPKVSESCAAVPAGGVAR